LSPDAIVGVDLRGFGTRLPINGLRHCEELGSSGWYLWAGTDFPLEDDAFEPMHAEHILQMRPELDRYLSLPAGYRFLWAPGYDDVWCDMSLLSDPAAPDMPLVTAPHLEGRPERTAPSHVHELTVLGNTGGGDGERGAVIDMTGSAMHDAITIEINPGVGVGPYLLGMTRDEVVAAAGADGATRVE
jgi:hypothetical protein